MRPISFKAIKLLNEQLPQSGTICAIPITLDFPLYVWKYLVIWYEELLLKGKYIQFSIIHNIALFTRPNWAPYSSWAYVVKMLKDKVQLLPNPRAPGLILLDL